MAILARVEVIRGGGTGDIIAGAEVLAGTLKYDAADHAQVIGFEHGFAQFPKQGPIERIALLGPVECHPCDGSLDLEGQAFRCSQPLSHRHPPGMDHSIKRLKALRLLSRSAG